jgi:hypothetical protein
MFLLAGAELMVPPQVPLVDLMVVETAQEPEFTAAVAAAVEPTLGWVAQR